MIRAPLLIALGAEEINAMRYAATLRVTAERYDITTPHRIAAFVAQLAHESARFERLEESLDYTAERMAAVWPVRFRGRDGQPNDMAWLLQHRPEAIANSVYGARMGNRGEMSGDGWRYRGRGLIQITGRMNYSQCSDALGLDLVFEPDLLLSPLYASLSAGWYWHVHRLNKRADVDDMRGITVAINGSEKGMEDRMALYAFARGALGDS